MVQRRKRRRGRARRLALAAQNALEIVRAGRLGDRYGYPYQVEHETDVFKLRHYPAVGAGPGTDAPLLLVPPLMVAADVYDIDEDVSAVAHLCNAGVDVWMVDYGAPERTRGGLERTLDDHVLAISQSVELVHAATGSDVHVAGYSQGGMFAYQAAGLRRAAGIASVITFGAPVDIHRNLPRVRDRFTGSLINMLRPMVALPLERAKGLPGRLTSTGFKLFSARKEAQQAVDFLRKLHDRKALEKREAKRLFLAGEGFVAWPGPALRTFVDEVIVRNRMASGGIVIDGRPVTLADITCPILAFVGLRDDMARAPSVRAIHRAAPNAEVYDVGVKAGHFGLVVGSTAQRVTWPAVVSWLRWHAGSGPKPEILIDTEAAPPALPEHDEDYDAAFDDADFDVELFVDVAAKGVSAAWERLGDAAQSVIDSVDGLRWQVPRLAKLRSMRGSTRISLGAALDRQAKTIPNRTFFIWKGRAFSYGDANTRVDNVVKGLIHCGVRKGHRVGVMMRVRPSYLSLIAALNRIGAVAVMLAPNLDGEGARACIEEAAAQHMVVDPESVGRVRPLWSGELLVLGGGPRRQVDGADALVDMEAIDPGGVTLPAGFERNPGRADDLAMIAITPNRQGGFRTARITHRRWAFSAYGAAASCTLSPKDTVYCCLPLHHLTGTLVSAGGALVGGARLAIATRFDPDEFWPDVRRYGATVVFYAGDMCRALVDAPHRSGDRSHPVRLFAGSGMRVDVWKRLIERFGPLGVLEFYASTEGNAVLVNASGDKIGALGRPLPGSSELAVVEYDFDAGTLARNERNRAVRCVRGEAGLLISRVDDDHPLSEHAEHARRIAADVFVTGDRWYLTGDIVRRDHDGDFWYVDRASDMVRTAAGPVATIAVEDAVYGCAEVRLAVCYGVPADDEITSDPVCAVVMPAGDLLDIDGVEAALAATLPKHQWPRYVYGTETMPMTTGYRPNKAKLRAAGIPPADQVSLFRYDDEDATYLPVEADDDE